MYLFGILIFAVQVLAVPTIIGAVLAFFLTGQRSENRGWRVVGYMVYTLLYAAVSYKLFFSRPRQGCDFSFILLPFIVPSWFLSVVLCYVGGKYYRKKKQEDEKDNMQKK